MADNTIINAPSTPGQTIATKDIAGVNHELVLLEFSDGLGGATEVSASDPLPVSISSDIEIGAVELKNATTDDRASIINSAPTTEFGLVTRNIPSGTQPVSAASLPLPTGAATETTLGTIDADTGNISTKIDTIAGAVSGTEMQVDVLTMPTTTVQATNLDIRDLTFAADKVDVSGSTGIGVTGTFFQATQPVSAATLPLPTGAATSALQTQPGVDIGDVTVNNAAGAAAVNIQDGGNAITVDSVDLDIRNLVFATDKVDVSGSTGVGVTGTFFQATQPVSAASLPLPSGAATETTLASIDAGIPAALGQTTMAASLPVAIASNQSSVPVKEVRSATPTQSSPSVTGASTVILASNANRLGATIYNEGAAICYMKLGGTASLTSYSLQIASGGYYEVPFGYTGAIDGITSSGTAQLRVTELAT